MKRKIYVASSWHNERQPSVVAALRAADHDVYDFRNPLAGDGGFAWSQLDPNYQSWTVQEFVHQLETNPIAARGFKLDKDALNWADTCVLLLPCGRSAHLEAGYACGQGKDVVVMLSEAEPLQFELMYLLATGFVTNTTELLAALQFKRNRCTTIGGAS